MARIDRLARWLAADILRERAVPKTPAAMASVLPLSYVLAEGVSKALAEVAAEFAAELTGATAVIRLPVAAGPPVAVDVDPWDLAVWECELDGARLEND